MTLMIRIFAGFEICRNPFYLYHLRANLIRENSCYSWTKKSVKIRVIRGKNQNNSSIPISFLVIFHCIFEYADYLCAVFRGFFATVVNFCLGVTTAKR